jgi:hypothetical protein
VSDGRQDLAREALQHATYCVRQVTSAIGELPVSYGAVVDGVERPYLGWPVDTAEVGVAVLDVAGQLRRYRGRIGDWDHDRSPHAW